MSATNIVVETQLTWLCFALRWKQEDCGWARCRQWGTERGVVLQVVHLGNLQLMNTENSTQKNTAHTQNKTGHSTTNEPANGWNYPPPHCSCPLIVHPSASSEAALVATKTIETLPSLYQSYSSSTFAHLEVFNSSQNIPQSNQIRLRGSLSKVLADTLPLLQSCCHF